MSATATGSSSTARARCAHAMRSSSSTATCSSPACGPTRSPRCRGASPLRRRRAGREHPLFPRGRRATAQARDTRRSGLSLKLGRRPSIRHRRSGQGRRAGHGTRHDRSGRARASHQRTQDIRKARNNAIRGGMAGRARISRPDYRRSPPSARRAVRGLELPVGASRNKNAVRRESSRAFASRYLRACRPRLPNPLLWLCVSRQLPSGTADLGA